MEITEETPIEELIQRNPSSAAVLRRFGLVCIQCGEPYWGTLGELAHDRGITDLQPILSALDAAGGREA